ncbi:hypothetical protein KI387_008780, partial [Taxus chinensis]
DQLAIAKEIGKRLGMGVNLYPSSALLGGAKDESIVALPIDELIEKADGFAGVFPVKMTGTLLSLVKNVCLREGITQVLDATSLTQTTMVDTARIQEAGLVKQQLKLGCNAPASEKVILEQASKAVGISQIPETANQKPPLKGGVSNPLSEACSLQSLSFKCGTRVGGFSQGTARTTTNHSLRETSESGNPNPVAKGVCHLPEGWSQVGFRKQKKGSSEWDEKGTWDASLPASSTFSPHNSIDSTSVMTAP